MRKRSITLAVVTVTVTVPVVALAGVQLYDSGRDDVIAEGVTIGHVDVGGLSVDEARRRLRTQLVAPVRRPLIVVAGDDPFPLGAREARLRVDVQAALDEAVRRGRDGTAIGRAWRGLTGGEVDATIRPRVRFDRAAVQRLVDKIRVQITREPREAKISFTPASVTVQRSKRGRTIDPRRVRALIWREVVKPTGDREIRAKIVKTKPRVSTAQVARRYPVVVTVDRSGYRIRLFKRLREVKSYPIALGQAGLETPAGEYTIQNKAVNPAWSVPNSPWAGSLAGSVIPGGAPNNPLKARWMGIYDGVGVHGTADRASIGTNASHGCIRMLVEDVEELYDLVPVGAPIYIA